MIIIKHILELDGEKITFNASDTDFEIISNITAELISHRGFVNMDTSDIVDILNGADDVSVGEGTASGDNRLEDAILAAMKNTAGTHGAKGFILEIKGGFEASLAEIGSAAYIIERNCPDAKSDVNIVWGHVLDGNMEDDIQARLIVIK